MGEVETWLAGLPERQAELLRPYVARARELVPEADEGRSYGMPALTYRGRGLVALVPTKSGYSVYPFSGGVVGAVMVAHPGWEHTKGSIHFTADRPLPAAVFDELVLAARADVDRRLDGRRRAPGTA